MARKKRLIAMDDMVHRKLKLMAADAEIHLGDAIDIMIQNAEARIDRARLSGDWAWPEQANASGMRDSLLYQLHFFTLEDSLEIKKLCDEKGLEFVPRPITMGGKPVGHKFEFEDPTE